MTLPLLVQQTVDEVNEIRAKLDMKPISDLPKGYRHTPDSCPVARALSNSHTASIFGSEIEIHARDADREEPLFTFDTPPNIRHFIRVFDDGIYPEYNALWVS